MGHCWACLVLPPLLLQVLVQPAGAQQQLSQGLLAGRCLLMEQAQPCQLPGRQPLRRCLLSVTMSRKLPFSHTALNKPGRMHGRMAPAPSQALGHSKQPRGEMWGQLGSRPA